MGRAVQFHLFNTLAVGLNYSLGAIAFGVEDVSSQSEAMRGYFFWSFWEHTSESIHWILTRHLKRLESWNNLFHYRSIMILWFCSRTIKVVVRLRIVWIPIWLGKINGNLKPNLTASKDIVEGGVAVVVMVVLYKDEAVSGSLDNNCFPVSFTLLKFFLRGYSLGYLLVLACFRILVNLNKNLLAFVWGAQGIAVNYNCVKVEHSPNFVLVLWSINRLDGFPNSANREEYWACVACLDVNWKNIMELPIRLLLLLRLHWKLPLFQCEGELLIRALY